MHDFIGNTTTNAASTTASLRATSALCNRDADHSAYWVPTLYQFDATIAPRVANIYYRTARRDPATIAPFPSGLRVIAGNAKASGLQPQSVVRWRCDPAPNDPLADPTAAATRRRARIRRHRSTIRRHRRAIRRLQNAGGSRARRAIARHRRAASRARRAARRLARGLGASGVPLCPSRTMLRLTIDFPDCWNGVHRDSSDHKSHLAYAVGGSSGGRVCPASHPVPVPQLTLNVRYTSRGGPGVRLASGEAYTAHADFFNAWDDGALNELVSRCLRRDGHCNR